MASSATAGLTANLPKSIFGNSPTMLFRPRKSGTRCGCQIVNFTCANCFWWFNMYSSVDYSITPRPMYPADGRKFFDVYSWPYSIREEIKKDLGEFPFFSFWGPAAGIDSPQGNADAASRWIAESAKWIETKYSPTLNLIYLPHLDYNFQRHGSFVVGDEVTSLICENRNINLSLLTSAPAKLIQKSTATCARLMPSSATSLIFLASAVCK